MGTARWEGGFTEGLPLSSDKIMDLVGPVKWALASLSGLVCAS